MSTTRSKKYFASQKTQSTNPMQHKEEVKKSNDNKIDQDFPGFPHGHSKENIINPLSEKDKRTADINNKDGEKINYGKGVDEGLSDGSGGAFEQTEKVDE